MKTLHKDGKRCGECGWMFYHQNSCSLDQAPKKEFCRECGEEAPEHHDRCKFSSEPRVVGFQDNEDPVDHPAHYTSHPSGVECITITEHMNFNLGNAFKYIWRASLKGINPIQDLKKAQFYLTREIGRIAGGGDDE